MPTITIGPRTGNTFTGLTVNKIKENAPTNNYATSAQGEVSSYAAADRAHSVLKTTGFSNIPAGQAVSSATLTLNLISGTLAGTAQLLALLLAVNTAQMTWNLRSTGNPWTSNGGVNATDVNLTALATFLLSTGGDVVIGGAGLTSYVQNAYSNPASDFGVLVARSPDTAYDSNYQLFAGSDDATNGPFWTITYAPAGSSVTSVSSNSAVEGTQIVHTVNLGAAPGASPASLAASLTAVTATGGNIDFDSNLANAVYSNGVTFSGGNLTLPAGAYTSFTIGINTVDDALNEAAETYNLTVAGVTGVGTMTDNDPLPSFSASDATQVGGTVTFDINMTPVSGRACSVDYATANAIKIAGVDYTGKTGTAAFPPGTIKQSVSVTVL